MQYRAFRNLTCFMVLILLIGTLGTPQASDAQNSQPEGPFTVFTPFGGEIPPQLAAEATADTKATSAEPTQCCSPHYTYTVRYSGIDETIWIIEASNLFGNADLNLSFINDEEVLSIESGGNLYLAVPDHIYFYGLDGTYTVIFRTRDGITKKDASLKLSYGFVGSPGNTTLTDVSIGYPDFYSDYVTSITPDGYTKNPGKIDWASRQGNTNFLGVVNFDFGVNVLGVSFAENNKIAHHTSNWPGNVFRRAQWLNMQVDFPEGTFDPATDVLIWSVQGPGDSEFVPISLWGSDSTADEWSAYPGALVNSSQIDQIYLPNNLPVGRYTLHVDSYRNTDSGSIYQDGATSAEFIVLFNPWNDDSDPTFDPDVYNPNFTATELGAYANAELGVNYYPDGSAPVQWLLQPFNPLIFYAAIDEIEGVSSADQAIAILRNKVQYDDSPSEILQGRWGAGVYTKNWRSVPAIMAAWDNGAAHPTGQCMDFGGVMASLAQSVGVPSRMLTCVNCGGWNFHVWDEVWVNSVSSSNWSPVDSTPLPNALQGVGPATPQDPYFQEETNGSSGLYTYDARSDSRVDVLGTYRTSPARFNNTLAAPQSNVLAISSDHAAYGFGDTVNLTVTVTNSGGSALSGQLQTQLYFVDYAGTYLLYTPAARSVSVLPGGSTSETFTVSRSQYQSPGQFLAVATLGSERAEARFQVNSGLSLDLAAPATANAGTPFAVTLNLTNTLTTALSNIDLMISFPSSASGVNPMTRLTIPSLAPGAGYSKSYTLAIPSADSAMITAYATSADGGNAEASAIIKMAGPASLEVQLELPPTVTPGETFNAVARVRNTGSQTAHNVSVNLSLSDGLTTSTPTSASQAQLAPGAEWKVTWPLKASAAGVYAVQVKAAIGTDTARSADGLITVARGDLAISLKSSEPYLKQPQKIVLTLTNESAVAAAINLIGVSSNPNIGFTIYDDSTGNPVQSPIIIPARSSVTLTLIIRAGDFEKGQISIRATAVENPQVAKTLVIRVNDLNTVYMPLIRR